MRIISYAIASENGRYNNTFLWGNVDKYLNFMSRYFPIKFVRTSDWGNARYRILQAAGSLTQNAFATTVASQRLTRISMTSNYAQHNYMCAKVLMHEFGHCLQTAFVHLSGTVDLMSASTGSASNFTQRDCYYFWERAYGMTLAPYSSQEKNRMREVFMPNTLSIPEVEFISCSCSHEEIEEVEAP